MMRIKSAGTALSIAIALGLIVHAGQGRGAVEDRPDSLAKPLTVQQEFRLPGDNGVKGLVNFSPDGKTLMVCQLRAVHLWDLSGAEPREAATFKASALNVRDILSAAISPDGKMVALGGYDKGVHLYSLKDMQLKELNNQMEHDGAVRSLQFSPDGSMLASGGDDMAMFLWDITGGHLQQHGIFKVENAMFGVQHLCFTPDGKTVFLDTGTGDVRQIDIGNGDPAQRRAWKEPSTLEMPMALSSDGKTLAFGSMQDVRFWNGTDIAICHGHTKQINSVVFDPDGQIGASCGEDGRLLIWDSIGQLRYSMQRPSPFDSVAFRPSSPNQTWIAGANRNGTVYLLHLRDAFAPAPKRLPSDVTPL